MDNEWIICGKKIPNIPPAPEKRNRKRTPPEFRIKENELRQDEIVNKLRVQQNKFFVLPEDENNND